MKAEPARRNGRSQAFFEDYPNCALPPLPPLQSPWDATVPDRLGLPNRPLVRGALRLGFLASGFAAFHRGLAGRVEDYVRMDLAPDKSQPPGPRHSAVLALADQPGADPFLRGASLLAALWELYGDFQGGRFRPDGARGKALETRPYLNLMGSSILFEDGAFRLVKTPSASRFLVLARRRMYVVDLEAGPEGPTVGAFRSALERVWETANSEVSPEKTLGMLTCAPGETQAAVFRALSQDPASREALEMVKDCFATLCLELDQFPESDAEAAAMWTGGDYGNRWAYSCLQTVVYGNGKACQIVNPNCGVPGNVAMRTAAELQRRGVALAGAGGGSAGRASITEPRWKLEDVSFEPAAAGLARLRDDQQATFDLTGIGRPTLEDAGLRPVEFFVIALQHVTYRLTGRLPVVRQMVAAEQYRYGMLGAAVVSTPEMAALQEALRDPGAAPAALRGLYMDAVESQRRACRGERSMVGVERQLKWFMSGLGGARRRYAQAVMNAVWRVVGQPSRPKSDLLISHPAIMEEVPVLGRPRVRLPQVNCFGLHYQILDDRIRLTFMPAVSWTFSNETVVAELEASLRELAERIGAGSAETATAAV